MANHKDNAEYTRITKQSFLTVPWGIAYDKSRRMMYVSASKDIVEITPDGTQKVLPLNPVAQYRFSCICLTKDGKILYCVDTTGNRIHKIDLITNTVSVVAGNSIGRKDGLCSVSAFHQPFGIALDQTEHNLFVCDAGNNCIRKIDLKNNIVSTITGKTKGNQDGHFEEATFYLPHGLCFDSQWNLYVSDYLGNKIRHLNFETKLVSTLLKSSRGDWLDDDPLEDPFIVRPTGMFYDPFMDCLWFGNGSCHIRRLDIKSKTVTTVAGTASAGFSWLTAPFTSNPLNMCMDHNRNIFITDHGSGILWKMSYNRKRDWKFVRLLWVGHLKNKSDSCWLARLPRDMVCEISKHFMHILYTC